MYKAIAIKECDTKYMKTKTYELNTLITLAKAADEKIKATGESDKFTKIGE